MQMPGAITLRFGLTLPLAICLALIIVLNDPVQRAVVVAALVTLEIFRDAISIGQKQSN